MASETEVVGPPIDNADRDKEALQYYTARVALMDQVIKLRPNAPAAPTDLHAITGYDYLSCAQWDAMLEQLLARIALPAEGIRFLDAGCGSGAVSDWAMRHYGARIAAAYGFDLTPALLEVAQARVQGPVFWTGDICEPASYAPVPAASLDLIVCFGVFIHLRSHAHAEQAMRNMYGTLKPGGTLFIGYNMDAYNRQEAEASRQKSQRREEFEKLLGAVPSYLYCGYKFFDDFAKEIGAQVQMDIMPEQFASHPLFDPLPRSFLGRCSVYLTKPLA